MRLPDRSQMAVTERQIFATFYVTSRLHEPFFVFDNLTSLGIAKIRVKVDSL